MLLKIHKKQLRNRHESNLIGQMLDWNLNEKDKASLFLRSTEIYLHPFIGKQLFMIKEDYFC